MKETALKSNKTLKLTISALTIALYVVVMATTSTFSFGAYQIRIATSLYALSYLFPFLVFPLGLANALSNFFFGVLGPIDVLGGFIEYGIKIRPLMRSSRPVNALKSSTKCAYTCPLAYLEEQYKTRARDCI